MELTIKKENVLDAASKCSTAKQVLKSLFPEVFNEMKAEKSVYKFGDIVRVKDGSNNKDKKTGEKRHGIDPLFKNCLAVVIETDLNLETHQDFETYKRKGELDSWMFSDLLLRFKSGEEVYTSSRMCTTDKDGLSL